jgi:hypothetical protein
VCYNPVTLPSLYCRLGCVGVGERGFRSGVISTRSGPTTLLAENGLVENSSD